MDSSLRIDYEDSSKYDNAISTAASAWNGLVHVTIAPDSFLHIEDLHFKDSSDCSGSDAAIWRQSFMADDIYFFTCWMDALHVLNQNEVAVHEVGHALGLDHINDLQGQNMVMRGDAVWCNCTAPQPHDVLDYNRRWAPDPDPCVEGPPIDGPNSNSQPGEC